MDEIDSFAGQGCHQDEVKVDVHNVRGSARCSHATVPCLHDLGPMTSCLCASVCPSVRWGQPKGLLLKTTVRVKRINRQKVVRSAPSTFQVLSQVSAAIAVILITIKITVTTQIINANNLILVKDFYYIIAVLFKMLSPF